MPPANSNVVKVSTDAGPKTTIEPDAQIYATIGGDRSEGGERAKSVPQRATIPIEGSFRGTEEELRAHDAPIVTLKIVGKRSDGGPIILDSNALASEKAGQDALRFRGNLKSPESPGKYLLQASRRGRVFAESEIDIE
ncbi:MAG: hypothetical protein ACKV0T_32000 [Planctomycetales bacterium]